MSEHAKGPWSVGWGTGLTGPTTPSPMGATCGEAVAQRAAQDAFMPSPERTSVPVSMGMMTVAIVPLPESGDIAERDANARLIAAAPRMLEVLKLVTQMHARPGSGWAGYCYDDRIGAMDQVRAAIADAEGRGGG